MDLLLGGVVWLVIVGVFLLILKFWGQSIKADRETAGAVAGLLGFEPSIIPGTDTRILKGDHAGFDAEVRYQIEYVSRGDTRRIRFTYFNIYFPEKLKIPVRIGTPAVWLERIISVFSGDKIKTGVPGFDKNFVVECADRSWAMELLTTRLTEKKTTLLLADLLAVRKTVGQISITEQCVTTRIEGELITEGELRRELDTAAYIAERVREAQKRILTAKPARIW